MNSKISSFHQLELSPVMRTALQAAEYETPTPIQAASIPPALAGRDVIGVAQTGTGKTAAFLIPILEQLRNGQGGKSALVLAPTRELAEQIHTWACRLGPDQKSQLVVGGLAFGPQAAGLRRRPNLIIATPGRLVDHIDQGTVSLKETRILVLDEADRMLDMGFKPQLDRILGTLPTPRQTLLYSATLANELGSLVRMHLREPVRVSVGPTAVPPPSAQQDVYLVDQMQKTSLLLSLIDKSPDTILVFARTKHRTDRVAKAVRGAGHAVQRLHSNRSQAQRREALEGFRDGRYRILIATDIAARGIDVANIGRVINFDLPHTVEDYVHRVGRTARAEARGHASSFASADEHAQLRAIERHLGSPLPRRDHASRQGSAVPPALPRETTAPAPRWQESPPRGGNRHHPGQPRSFNRAARRNGEQRRSNAFDS